MQPRSMLRVFAVIFLYLLLFGSARAQEAQPIKPTVVGGNQGVDGWNCDTTKAAFDHIAQTAGSEDTIIVIGRLGRGEISHELIRRRLQKLEELDRKSVV